MSRSQGFTLIEVLITTAILVTGLTAAASMFSYCVRVNWTSRQQIAATILLQDKLEEFSSKAISDPLWQPGGGLNPASPAAGHFDCAAAPAAAGYLRLWQITAGPPAVVTVVVYSQCTGLTPGSQELARGAAYRSASF